MRKMKREKKKIQRKTKTEFKVNKQVNIKK